MHGCARDDHSGSASSLPAWSSRRSSGSHRPSSADPRPTRRRSASAWSRCSTRAISPSSARPGPTSVGDIALYESPVLHRPVLHRIIVIQGPRYYFKGDNNDFVDPGYVTRDEILGKLWTARAEGRQPGSASSASPRTPEDSPASPCSCCCSADPASGKRRRRRRRRGTPDWKPPVLKIRFAQAPPPAPIAREHPGRARADGRPARALRRLHDAPCAHGAVERRLQPDRHLLVLEHARPARRRLSRRQGDDRSAGVPHRLQDARRRVRLPLRIAAAPSRRRHDRARGGALVDEFEPGTRTYVLQKAVAFQGDVARVTGTVDLHATARRSSEQIAIDTGTPGDGLRLDACSRPCACAGVVDGKQISKTFAPTLPFTFSTAVLALNAPAPATAAGRELRPADAATRTRPRCSPCPPAACSCVHRTRSRSSSSPSRSACCAASASRLVGLALLGLCTKPLRKKRDTWSHEKRVAFRFGCVIVDVVSLESAVASTGVPTALPDFASLASFARYLERPILHDTLNNAYAVEDSGRLYVFRPTGGREATAAPIASLARPPLRQGLSYPAAPGAAAAHDSRLSRVAVRRRRSRCGLVTSFTATNDRAPEPRRRLEVDDDADPADPVVLLEPRAHQARGRDRLDDHRHDRERPRARAQRGRRRRR